jgi:hypothetical protein
MQVHRIGDVTSSTSPSEMTLTGIGRVPSPADVGVAEVALVEAEK